MLADSLKLDVEPVNFDNAVGSLDWGTLQNGSWIGVLSYLADNKSDTACLFYQRTDLREQYFELSYPITNVQPVYVVRKQKTTIGSVLWNAFKPYSYSTWLGIVGNGMLFLFALLQSAFFTYLYEGLLLSALIQQTDQNPFKDADEMIDLIAQKKYHLVTNYRGNWYFDELDHSNSSHFAKLRAATSSNPVEVTKSVSDALDLVEKGNYIYPIQEDSLAMQRSKERCNFVYVSKGLPQRSAHLVFPNNSMFLEKFNNAIITQSQFIQRTFSKYFLQGFKIADIPKCPATEFEEGSKPLGVQSVIGIFALGALGMSSALVAFVAEVSRNCMCAIAHNMLTTDKS
ncbi:unnamed protein product [Cylicocyclus nassatus]|uniref:Uncharacterized protein n=1 Tax=Cylicocyclus nassatus TaxID=53992 RepID=A0AA36H5F5_CYLNA|nr:unnamed protein product [Cylicocyclus nassatus]